MFQGAHVFEIVQGLAHRHSFEDEPLIGNTPHEAVLYRRIQSAADAHFQTYRIAEDGEVQIVERDAQPDTVEA